MPVLRFKQNSHDDDLSLATSTVGAICNYAEELLAETPIMSDLDQHSIKSAACDLSVGFDAMKVTIDMAFGLDEKKRQAAYHVLAKMMLDAFVVGGAGSLSHEGKEFLHKMKAFNMRQERSRKQRESPEEIALVAAIQAEHGGLSGSVFSPYKEAEIIHGGVNARLKEQDFAPVHLDKIRRRLEKMVVRS